MMEALSPWLGPSRQLPLPPLLPPVVQVLLRNLQRPQGQRLRPCFQAARLLRQSAQLGLLVQVCPQAKPSSLGNMNCCLRLLFKMS